MHKIKPIKEKLSSQGAAFYVATIHSNYSLTPSSSMASKE